MDLDWSAGDNRRFRSSRKFRAPDEVYGPGEECLFVQDGSAETHHQRNPNHEDRAKVIGGKKNSLLLVMCFVCVLINSLIH